MVAASIINAFASFQGNDFVGLNTNLLNEIRCALRKSGMPRNLFYFHSPISQKAHNDLQVITFLWFQK